LECGDGEWIKYSPLGYGSQCMTTSR
jgi:hypothetical protein